MRITANNIQNDLGMEVYNKNIEHIQAIVNCFDDIIFKKYP